MPPLDAPRPVLVARPAGRGATLLARLQERGIPAEHQPLLRLEHATDEELHGIRERLTSGAYSHLVITSRTAAEALGAVVVPPGTAVIAVGAGTAAALDGFGITATLVADGSGAALVAELPLASPGATVLFPASAAASATVPEGLRAKGYRVHQVTAYRPQRIEPPAAVAVALATGHYGAIVLTSPMIARHAAALGVHPSTPIISIGDPTSAAVRAAGLPLARQATEPTDEALAAAVQQVLAAGPPLTGPSTARPSAADPSTARQSAAEPSAAEPLAASPTPAGPSPAGPSPADSTPPPPKEPR
ncbi:uroporphyrinogen-III synthase [Brachybacterium paraconglomeratum]|uniref:uroporphyrinogen-III synthase n=1 Tax=Brachybacterium paraconglomeratum TaxID=173362 RepID=UPI0031EA133D